jgi:hypothetical protein
MVKRLHGLEQKAPTIIYIWRKVKYRDKVPWRCKTHSTTASTRSCTSSGARRLLGCFQRCPDANAEPRDGHLRGRRVQAGCEPASTALSAHRQRRECISMLPLFSSPIFRRGSRTLVRLRVHIRAALETALGWHTKKGHHPHIERSKKKGTQVLSAL